MDDQNGGPEPQDTPTWRPPPEAFVRVPAPGGSGAADAQNPGKGDGQVVVMRGSLGWISASLMLTVGALASEVE